MADEENGAGKELDVTLPGGAGVRAKGYRLMDVVALASVLVVGYVAVLTHAHTADEKDSAKTVAEALKESNKTIANALKESNVNTAEAIKGMAAEQRRATTVLREMNCLLSLPPDRRVNAQDFCKRIARDNQ